MKKGILNFSREELIDIFRDDLGLKKYQVDQVLLWIFRYGVKSFFEMTNINKNNQRKLDDYFYIYRPNIVNVQKSEDGTIKFLLELPDHEDTQRNDENLKDTEFLERECQSKESLDSIPSFRTVYNDNSIPVIKNSLTNRKKFFTIETVFIPSKKRNTICVSSQVGCVVGCKFCNTGYNGFKRSLSTEEIVGQYFIVKDYLGLWGDSDERLSNIVYMGMGEPLYNINNVLKSIDSIIYDEKEGLSRRKITVSTSGIVPVMKDIIKDLKCRLAISLHAPNNKIRSEIMPINDIYDIDSLIDVCREYCEYHPSMRITFEYLLLKDINDSKECAYELVDLIRGLNAKVNIIQFNSWEGSTFIPSPKKRVLDFVKILEDSGIEAPIRERRGEDIMAACGQLKSSKLS